MSIKNKFKNFFYLDEYEEEQPTPQAAQPKRPIKPQRRPSVSPEPVKKPVSERRERTSDTQNVINLQSVSKSAKVTLIEPHVYAEAQDIADLLRNKRAVVVNLQRIERDQGIRIIDFLSGTVYALGGDIQRIGTDIFLCVPDNVEVDGVISDFYFDDQL